MYLQSVQQIVQIDYDRNSVKLEFGRSSMLQSHLRQKGEEHQKLIKKIWNKMDIDLNKLINFSL